MLPTIASVDWARWQFAIDASYHFLFVPLTLGLAWILFTMELCYVITGKQVYKDMTKFWGKLFGINFALGVLTGLTMEFQFGTNWAYYSQFVGDIFGTPLAIEGLVAFMLESTFLGLFFFGWDKLSKVQHVIATFCLALGSSLSALLILVANGFMQHPAGAYFSYTNMRMQTSSLLHLILNPFAQVGFAHTVIAGYTTGAAFVLGISAFYLLKKRDMDFAKRSFAIAAGFGLIASMMVIFMGDQNGLLVAKYQPIKLDAIEAEWVTHPAPAAFNLFAIPSQRQQRNYMDLQIPGALGLIATHSTSKVIPGMKQELGIEVKDIQKGMLAYAALDKIRHGDKSPQIMADFNKYKADLGYGLLLKRFTNDISEATAAQVKAAAVDTLPDVFSLFWTFRIMVAIGFLLFFTFLLAFIFILTKDKWRKHRWLSYWALYAIPLPWIACLCGWFVTEHGRQPWTVYGVLPTTLSSSTISAVDIGASFFMFILLYTILFIVEMYLMFKFARLGPSSLHTGRYHFEKLSQQA